MNKYLTWSGFHCFSVCFVPSVFGFFRCIRISEWTHLQFPLGFCGSDQLPFAVFKLILQIFCWLASFLFDRFDYLHSASFLICFCFFWILLLFSCCVWLPDFARFRFLQLLFWSFRFCPFDSVFTNFPVPYSFFDSSACFRYCPFHSETSSKM